MTESYVALVGWGHHDAGERVMLRIESARSMEAADEHDPDMFRVVLSEQLHRATEDVIFVSREMGFWPKASGPGT